MGELGRHELEEAVQLVGVASQPRRQPRRIGVRRLDGADLQLEPVVEALDPAEHADGVSLGEAAVEQLDVVPDPTLDATGRVDELQCEVRRALPRRPPLLSRDGVDALDRAVGSELGDGAHAVSLGRGRVGTLPAMAVVKPFRALRYDEAVAGPLETLVAPPYDVITDEQREELQARSPYNVVRLTLPDSEEEAARALDDWRARRCPRRGAAGGLGARAGLRRPRRDRADALRHRRLAEGRALRDGDGAAARANPRRARRRAASACSAPRAPSWSRSFSSTTAPRRSSGLTATRISRSRARSCGASTTRRSCARSTTSSC